MKKLIIFICIILSLSQLYGQVGRMPYQTIRQSYFGDTLETTLNENVEFTTNLEGFSFSKILVIQDTNLLDLIKAHGKSGGGLASQTLTEDVIIDLNSFEISIDDINGNFYLGGNSGLQNFGAFPMYLDLNATESAIFSANNGTGGGMLNLSESINSFEDFKTAPTGIVYEGDYSGTFVEGSLINKGYADKTYIKKAYYTGELTDGAPTSSEIVAVVGETASNLGESFQCLIKDSDGTGLVYGVISDGTNFFYWTTSIAQ